MALELDLTFSFMFKVPVCDFCCNKWTLKENNWLVKNYIIESDWLFNFSKKKYIFFLLFLLIMQYFEIWNILIFLWILWYYVINVTTPRGYYNHKFQKCSKYEHFFPHWKMRWKLKINQIWVDNEFLGGDKPLELQVGLSL